MSLCIRDLFLRNDITPADLLLSLLVSTNRPIPAMLSIQKIHSILEHGLKYGRDVENQKKHSLI